MQEHTRRIPAQAHLLLIDDNPADRELLERELRRAHPGFRYTHVANDTGLQAALDRDDYDLAVTDYELRWTTGLEVLRAIKARDRDRPVVMFTGSGSEEIAVEAMKEGLDDYLTKSSRHFARIPHTVAAVLERAQQRQEIHRQARLLDENQRVAARQLRESEERFRAVQETSPDGFTVLEAVRDASGAIIDFRWAYLNEAASRIARAPRESLIGHRILEEHPGNRVTGIFDRYVEVTQTGKPWVGEVSYEHDGIDAYVRLAVARVGDGVAISTVDISERRRAEQRLRDADRQKDEFLAMLAHELRNPLAPIRNSGELLARMLADQPRAMSIIEIVRRQVAHLARLVDDLLDVSRITRGRIELRREPIDLADVISQAVETVDPLMRSRRHELRVVSKTRHLLVHGDFARLVQCVVNVLTNAAKFTDPGGRVRVESRSENGMAIVEVSDNGAGISATLIPRIFDLFVQNDQTLDRAQGGLGIGLSVVQRLIDMHGGDVTARSEGPGHGATFVIRLPLVERAADPATLAPLPHLAACRILVVDDNADAADTLAMMLEAEGHESQAVHGAHEVLERIAAFKPHAVLLDIGLPGMDGYELARRIREQQGTSRITLIALTGYGQPEDRARALQAGFDEHLVKPVELGQLLRTLGELGTCDGRSRTPV